MRSNLEQIELQSGQNQSTTNKMAHSATDTPGLGSKPHRIGGCMVQTAIFLPLCPPIRPTALHHPELGQSLNWLILRKSSQIKYLWIKDHPRFFVTPNCVVSSRRARFNCCFCSPISPKSKPCRKEAAARQEPDRWDHPKPWITTQGVRASISLRSFKSSKISFQWFKIN